MNSTPDARFHRALDSLEGLSVGDAFGEGFFMSFELAARLLGSGEFAGPPFDFQDEFVLKALIQTRRTDFLAQPWRWTDDTALALEVVAELEENRFVDADSLASRFAWRYSKNPLRGYGGAMHGLLPNLIFGDWKSQSQALFNGSGSFGNGAAMRVAPLGAYFADDFDVLVSSAALSAQITHAHFEGVAGAVAVAVAAGLAALARESGERFEARAFLTQILARTPQSEVSVGIRHARGILGESVDEAARLLGSGEEVSAQDTVPFCLWCAARNLDNFEQALWETVAGLGDRDTTCAIVGGIVGARVGTQGIPARWRESRESLEAF